MTNESNARNDDARCDETVAWVQQTEASRRHAQHVPPLDTVLARARAEDAPSHRRPALRPVEVLRLARDLLTAQVRLVPRSALPVMVATATVVVLTLLAATRGLVPAIGVLFGGAEHLLGLGCVAIIVMASATVASKDAVQEVFRAAWIPPSIVVAARLVLALGTGMLIALGIVALSSGIGLTMVGPSYVVTWMSAGLVGAAVVTVMGIAAGSAAAWSTGLLCTIVAARVMRDVAITDIGAAVSLVLAVALLIVAVMNTERVAGVPHPARQ